MKGAATALLMGFVSFAAHATLDDGLTYLRKGYCAQAQRELTESAEQGNKDAQALLGVMYRDGYCTEVNHALAVKWLQAAAQNESADAFLNLGLMYALGWGVEQNYLEAFHWYRKASAAGIPFSGSAALPLGDADDDSVALR